MSGVYTVTMEDVAVVADATLILIHAETAWGTQGSLLEVLRATCGQRGSSTSEQLGIMLGKKVTAFGTYTSATPNPHAIGGPVSGIVGGTAGAAGTAGVDASAEGAGAFTSIVNEGFNNLNGWIWVPTPEERFLVGPDDAIALKLDGTPATLTNWYATLTYRELG